MASDVPLLPDFRRLVAGSPWVAGRPWLPDEAALWQRELPAVRRRLEREAAALARPRVWYDTVASLATTGWRMASTAAPDAPLAILTAAASAFGLPVAPSRTPFGVEQAEQLVRAGGPAYVKLGQFIASADGLLPAEWVEAFAWCRDRVEPIPGDHALETVQREVGPIDVDPEPFAAASIGQVHNGTLEDGTEVVVKVRRPGLRRQFASDVEALALVAAAAHRLHEGVRIANLPGFVALFARLALEELDFRLEALNMVELGAALHDAGLDFCAVPRPIPGYVTERVLVMERMPGVPYDRAAATYGSALQGERLLQLSVQGVLHGTLVYGRFHGDLHAGNVLIDGGDRFSLVDFGIVGRLGARERAALVRFLMGFAADDASEQLAALTDFGAIPLDADLQRLERELQADLDAGAMHGVTFDRLGEAVGGSLRLLAAHGFQLPPALVLFFKNLLYLGAFAAEVAPEADLMAAVANAVGSVAAGSRA